MTHRQNHRDPIPSHSPWHPKSCRLLSFANDHGRPISQGRLLCNLDGSRSTNSCPAKLAPGFPAGCSNRRRTCGFNVCIDPLGGTNIQRLYRFHGQGPRYLCQSRSPGCQTLANKLSQERSKGPKPKYRLEPCRIAAHGPDKVDSSTNPDAQVSGPLATLR